VSSILIHCTLRGVKTDRRGTAATYSRGECVRRGLLPARLGIRSIRLDGVNSCLLAEIRIPTGTFAPIRVRNGNPVKWLRVYFIRAHS